jgi:uridine kinase
MPVLVGIAGGSGSGKSTLARNIADALPGQVLVIAHDAYYLDRSDLPPAEREQINFDEPAALDNRALLADLQALKGGRAIEQPHYDFATHSRTQPPLRLQPHPVVLVEGALLLAVPELRAVFDLRVFVDTPDDIRLLRRIRRDVVERGRSLQSIEQQYLASVRPMHERYVAPSLAHAEVVVPEGGHNHASIQEIVARVTELLRG